MRSRASPSATTRLDRRGAAARRLARLAAGLADRARSPTTATSSPAPPTTSAGEVSVRLAGRARAAGAGPRGPDDRDGLGALGAPRPRPGRAARALARRTRDRARVDDPRRLPRRDRRARRGHPPGAAARPDLPARRRAPRARCCRDAPDHLPRRGDGRRRAAALIERDDRAGPRAARRRPPRAQRRHDARAHLRAARRRDARLEQRELWFADERCVGPEDEESNYRLAHETLLGPAGIAHRRVHRMEGELGPEDGARRYAAELAQEVPAERDGGALPVLDLIVLGIGPDGHIASLFPGAPDPRRRRGALLPRRPRLAQATARADHAQPRRAARRARLPAARHRRGQGRRGRRDARRADPARAREPAAARAPDRDRRRRRRATAPRSQ